MVQIGDEVVQIGEGFLTSLIKFLLRFYHLIKLIGHVSDSIDVILVPRFPSGPDKVAPNKPNFHLFISLYDYETFELKFSALKVIK